MISDKVGAGDLRDRLKHRSSCSTLEEDFAAATVMNGSAFPLSMLSQVATQSARHPAQRAIAVAISSLVENATVHGKQNVNSRPVGDEAVLGQWPMRATS